jgi:hypothetical protein
MHRNRPILSALLALLLLSGAALGAESPSTPADPIMTIGEFALQAARLAEPDAARRAALSPPTAVDSLRRAGLKLHGELADPLTEGEMSAFLRQAGIAMRAAHPESPVSTRKAAAVLSTFGSVLAVRATDPRIALVSLNNTSNAIGPEDFSDCAALPTVTECRTCCSSLSGFSSGTCGKACGRAHATQQVSASEPTP